MTSGEAKTCCELIAKLFPRTDWAPEVFRDVHRRFLRFEREQVEAIIYEVRATYKFDRPAPAHFLDRCRALTERGPRMPERQAVPDDYEPSADFAGAPRGAMDAEQARQWLLSKIERGDAVSPFCARWARSQSNTESPQTREYEVSPDA